MILYACSSNAGKLNEFALAARDSYVKHLILQPLPNLKQIAPPEEIGASFEENAAIKAAYYSRLTRELVFADDSGLEVDALGGLPGVRSARYAGLHATDAENNELLLRNLAKEANRSARFVCVIALARAGQILRTCYGIVAGQILTRNAGTGGFGYDPLFFYPPCGRSFAQLSATEKLLVSHRGQALRRLFDRLSEVPQ